MGSSRDWAAKGTLLLGRARGRRDVLRAHPPQQPDRHGRAAARVRGRDGLRGPRSRRLGAHLDIAGIGADLEPGKVVTVRGGERPPVERKEFQAKVRIDTPDELAYYRNGGILNYVLAGALAEVDRRPYTQPGIRARPYGRGYDLEDVAWCRWGSPAGPMTTGTALSIRSRKPQGTSTRFAYLAQLPGPHGAQQLLLRASPARLRGQLGPSHRAFPDFRFTQVHGAFTHGPLDDTHPDQARAFLEGLSPLIEAKRLLALLAQFPVSFREGEAGWARLERIRGYFPDPRVLLELRHRSWFEPDAIERIGALGFGLAHIDLPSARDHPPETHSSLGDLAYLRLHGRNRRTWFDAKAGRDDRYDYRYDRREVRTIAGRLEQLGKGTERSLLVANNHFGGQAVANALELKGLFTGEKPRTPEPLLLAFPDLREHVRPEGQLSLF